MKASGSEALAAARATSGRQSSAAPTAPRKPRRDQPAAIVILAHLERPERGHDRPNRDRAGPVPPGRSRGSEPRPPRSAGLLRLGLPGRALALLSQPAP